MLLQKAENLGSASDAELIARALRRDQAAVRAIVQRHNRRLYRLARSIVRNDAEAEDVLQEAYLRAFTNLPTFRGESGLGTWLGRVVINEALGRLRRERPTVELTERAEAAAGRPPASRGEVIPFPGEQIDPERIMAQRQIHSLLERAIDNRPDAFRTVLVARVIEEMSVEETATLLNLQPETVKTRLHRARKLVRAALEQQIGSVLTEAFPFAGRRCERVADAVVPRLGLTKHSGTFPPNPHLRGAEDWDRGDTGVARQVDWSAGGAAAGARDRGRAGRQADRSADRAYRLHRRRDRREGGQARAAEVEEQGRARLRAGHGARP